MNEKTKLGVTLGVFGVILVGMLIGLYFRLKHYGYGPFDDGTTSLNAQLKSAQKRVDQLEEIKTAILPEKQKELKALEPQKALAAQLLPGSLPVDELLGAINNKAKESRVGISAITPQKGKGDSGFGVGEEYEEWSFRIEMYGNYDDIGVFVNKMEEFELSEQGKTRRRFFAVKEIRIEPEGEVLREVGLHKCEITVLTFRYTGGDSDGA